MIRVWELVGYKRVNDKFIKRYSLGIGKTKKIAEIRAKRKHDMHLRKYIA